jgi:hypothetical protein
MRHPLARRPLEQDACRVEPLEIEPADSTMMLMPAWSSGTANRRARSALFDAARRPTSAARRAARATP